MSNTAFTTALAANIRAKVTELKADGTVGMSPDNLMMVVRIPAGAPLGTNARYYYKQAFRETLAKLRLDGFEILTNNVA
jgi:hypothetical protein